METYDLPINYKEESKIGVYTFLIHFAYKLYDILKIDDIVTFNAGEKKIKAKIFDIRYFETYNKYYCKEVE